MSLRAESISTAAYGTCGWLYSHKSYSTWLGQHGLLWIKGKPGAGKSTLLNYALRSIRQGSDNFVTASFFFHGRGHFMQKTPIGLFRSLLHQILTQIRRPLLSEFHSIFKRKRETQGIPGKDWDWGERELRDFLETIATDNSKAY